MKLNICDTPAERFLKDDVCLHLKPIEDFLVSAKKVSYRSGEQLVNDRSDGFIRYVDGDLDLVAVADAFDLPDFIILQDDYGIFCKRCWCSIKKTL